MVFKAVVLSDNLRKHSNSLYYDKHHMNRRVHSVLPVRCDRFRRHQMHHCVRRYLPRTSTALVERYGNFRNYLMLSDALQV